MLKTTRLSHRQIFSKTSGEIYSRFVVTTWDVLSGDLQTFPSLYVATKSYFFSQEVRRSPPVFCLFFFGLNLSSCYKRGLENST